MAARREVKGDGWSPRGRRQVRAVFADRVREVMADRDWTIDEAAARLGVARATVTKWRGAKCLPDGEQLLRLARVTARPMDFFFPGIAPTMGDQGGLAEAVRDYCLDVAGRLLPRHRDALPFLLPRGDYYLGRLEALVTEWAQVTAEELKQRPDEAAAALLQWADVQDRPALRRELVAYLKARAADK